MAVWKGPGLWVPFPALLIIWVVLGKLLCVFVPQLSHLSNEDLMPTPLWAVGRSHRLEHPVQCLASFLFCPCYVSSLLGTNPWLALTGVCPTPLSLRCRPTPPRSQGDIEKFKETLATRWGEVSIPFLAKHRFAAGKLECVKEWLWPKPLCFTASSLCLDYNKLFFLLSLPSKP